MCSVSMHEFVKWIKKYCESYTNLFNHIASKLFAYYLSATQQN